MICGLTATTITRATAFGGAATLAMPALARIAALSAGGDGSTTTTDFGSSPRSSQPASNAPPILPAPTSASGCDGREFR